MYINTLDEIIKYIDEAEGTLPYITKPTNSLHLKQNNSVNMVNINCNWRIALCDDCNQSIIPCGPGKISIRS